MEAGILTVPFFLKFIFFFGGGVKKWQSYLKPPVNFIPLQRLLGSSPKKGGESHFWVDATVHILCFPQWYDLDSLEQFPFPLGYDVNITPFQKLLILRCFRVDRVYRAVTDYVTITMGEKWVSLCLLGPFCGVGYLMLPPPGLTDGRHDQLRRGLSRNTIW